MSNIKYFSENLDIQNKTVILRLDLNVPINERKILDSTRINLNLPFLESLIKKKAKIIIISHLGRPKGVMEEKFNQDIEDLSQETENLVSEIEKWQT